jgi:hypothetical protein
VDEWNDETITEGWRALELFTDRYELCRRFLSYGNDDSSPSSILYFMGTGVTASRSSSTISGRTSASVSDQAIGPTWRLCPLPT